MMITLLEREWIALFPSAKDINFAELFSSSSKVHTGVPITPCGLSADQKRQFDQVLVCYEDIFNDIPGKLIGLVYYNAFKIRSNICLR